MTLHPGANTAGKIAKHVLVFMTHPTTHGHHVARAAVLRIDRSENVIEQSLLFKLGVLDVRMDREETARHFEHVVDVARLVGPAVDTVCQLIRWSKVFILAVTAGRISVVVAARVPKELGRN